MEEIEQEEDESAVVAGVRGILDQAEGGGAVGPDAAQLAVEIGLSRWELCKCRSDRRVFGSPVESGAGQQADHAPVQPGMHPVAIEFEFVQPLRPIGRLVPSLVSCGFTQFGSAVASVRRLSASDRGMS